jgi:nucleotidyltransferase substrate binding protein (TIGR01987 family)
MSKQNDIRWELRFMNYKKALAQLANGLDIEEPSDLEREGIIQRFEYTFDLAWKTLKDYLEFQGIADITGSRDTFREAFSFGMIEKGDLWMEMIESRNLTSHTYNEETASKILESIRNEYLSLFKSLEERLIEEKKS